MPPEVRPALVILTVLTLLTGLAYPLGVTAVAGLLFPHQAHGSLVEQDGCPIGSALIGQPFAGERTFHGRPSATTAADPNDPAKTVPAPYNAANSGGSNLGPTSRALIERVRGDLDGLEREHPSQPVPIDLVTASGSGLDPHVSPEAALFQVPRVARARGLSEDVLRRLVTRHVEERQLGFLGELRVNVLALNRALDALAP